MQNVKMIDTVSSDPQAVVYAGVKYRLIIEDCSYCAGRGVKAGWTGGIVVCDRCDGKGKLRIERPW